VLCGDGPVTLKRLYSIREHKIVNSVLCRSLRTTVARLCQFVRLRNASKYQNYEICAQRYDSNITADDRFTFPPPVKASPGLWNRNVHRLVHNIQPLAHTHTHTHTHTDTHRLMQYILCDNFFPLRLVLSSGLFLHVCMSNTSPFSFPPFVLFARPSHAP